MSSPTSSQPNNPLHGVTLQVMLETLVKELGWPRLADEIRIRCFANDPSVKSSLTFLRRTPWARAKVESLYLCREVSKAKAREARKAADKAAKVPGAVNAKSVANAKNAAKANSAAKAAKPTKAAVRIDNPKKPPAPGAKAAPKPKKPSQNTLSLKKKTEDDAATAAAPINANVWGKASKD
ncbi:VF530 family DNA-binding protein [Shewanella khirikhana]|uniref:VF530 family protein n=1 Tax=Shewanella khirikhana TaxID=1965282 RepID=UPI003BAEA9B9